MSLSIATPVPAPLCPLLLVYRAAQPDQYHAQPILSDGHVPEDFTPSLPLMTDPASAAVAVPVGACIRSLSVFSLTMSYTLMSG